MRYPRFLSMAFIAGAAAVSHHSFDFSDSQSALAAESQVDSAKSKKPVAPYITDLERAYNNRIATSERIKNARDQKSRAGDMMRELSDLLRERIRTPKEEQEAIDVLVADDSSQFAGFARQALLSSLLISGRRDAVVELLSRWCPREVGITEIELLVVVCRKTPGELLVFCDAFDRSRVPSVKKELGDALRRALSPLGVSSTDDNEMVTLTRRWYSRERNRYNIDTAYEGPDTYVNIDGKRVNIRRALFSLKEN